MFSIVLALAYWAVDMAAQSPEVITERFAIYYRFDRTDIDTSYLYNPGQIRHILDYLEKSERIDSITIYAWASPEGAYQHNKWLSVERAKTARDFLLQHSPDSLQLNSGKIKISPLAENWPGLIELVEKNYFRHDREKVLKILNTEGIGDETRKWRLKQLDAGYTWNYLVRRYMPELRSATWICVWKEVIEPLDRVMQLRGMAVLAPEKLSRPQAAQEVVRKTVLAARTNLLVPAHNIGLEVPVGNRWSIGADYYYPWMSRKRDNMNCFQLLGWNIEGRYWFGRDRQIEDRLKGHSIGLTIGAGYYDMERNYAGHQGEYAAVCLDYLYSLPIWKDKLHLEFTIGAGYMYSTARPYDVFEAGGKAFKEGYIKNFHWLGPLKAGVSLVVPIKVKTYRNK